MDKSHNSDSSKLDRKTIEKNRRIHMKSLCSKLASLIPTHHSLYKDILSQQGQLEHAALYIKALQQRVEELKREKQILTGSNNLDNGSDSMSTGLSSPLLHLKEMDSALEVTLVCGLYKNFMFYQVINVLEEEGARVVNASFSRVGDNIYHTIHCEVLSSRVGVESSRLSGRLTELVTG